MEHYNCCMIKKFDLDVHTFRVGVRVKFIQKLSKFQFLVSDLPFVLYPALFFVMTDIFLDLNLVCLRSAGHILENNWKVEKGLKWKYIPDAGVHADSGTHSMQYFAMFESKIC